MFNRPPPQWTQEQVKDEMILLGISDVKIHEGYYLHYKAQGWKRGNGQHIMCLKAHITLLKNDDYLWKLRKYATKPKSKPASNQQKARIREEYQGYLEAKPTEAMRELKTEGGHLAGLCGWLIDEILAKRKGG